MYKVHRILFVMSKLLSQGYLIKVINDDHKLMK